MSGFIALTITILAAAALLATTLLAGQGAQMVRAQTHEQERAAMSRAHAYACAHVALFELAADSLYVPQQGGDVIYLPHSAHCSIESIFIQGDERLVHVSGREGLHTTRLEFFVTPTTLSSQETFMFDFIKI